VYNDTDKRMNAVTYNVQASENTYDYMQYNTRLDWRSGDDARKSIKQLYKVSIWVSLGLGSLLGLCLVVELVLGLVLGLVPSGDLVL